MRRHKRTWFEHGTVAVLLIFTGCIVALFVATVSYIDAEPMREVLTSHSVRHALFLTVVCSVISTLLSILVAVPSGYALSRQRLRGAMVYDILVDALIVLPVLVIGMSILVFFHQTRALPGVGGFFLWLGNLFIHRVPGIVLAMFFCSASFAVRVMKATFDEMDPRTEHVAMTLGCTRWGAFWRVVLPQARHGLIAAAVLSWARAVGVYGPIMIVAGAVEGKTYVLPSHIFVDITVGRLKAALAISLIMIAMAFIVLLLLKTFSKSSLFGAGGAE